MSDKEEIKNEEVTEECNEEKDATEILQTQIEELKDKLLRVVAESQNIQKRAEKEKADISKYSISEFAKDILRVRDNLQLAIVNSNEEQSLIIDGVKLTMAELDKILNNYGITLIESLGKPFDPHRHQAMIEIESKDQEPGLVVQVMQEGFMIKDRLLRPALVGVSKK